MKFPFGKYKSEDIKEVSQTEDGEQYCRWLVRQSFCPQEIYDYIVYELEI